MPYKDREKERECKRKYQQKNKKKIKERMKWYQMENKETIKKQRRKYRQEHKEERRVAWRKWAQENREKLHIIGKRYRKKHREQIRVYNSKWHQENRDENNIRCRKRGQERALSKIEGFCQFDGCGIDDPYMLTNHHPFPGDKEIEIILCANHHLSIDHYKEGFYKVSDNT